MMKITLLTIPEEEQSKLETILEKVRDFFFESGEYENFSTASQMTSLRIFITALLVGVFAFVAFFAIKKRAAKRFVDAVNRMGAYTPEGAVTLEEMGLHEDKGVLRALKNGALSRLTSSVEQDEYNRRFLSPAEEDSEAEGEKERKKKKVPPAPYRANPAKDRFYLTEEKAASLASLYGGKMGAVSTIVLTAAGCVALWFVLDRAIPFFLSLLDSGLG